ncbi:diphosphomevalonate/mevalonate 3,5-bisphosphate decarboxylase family protein [Salinimicrobium sp. TH3]|uniref:diphosphomevalonate/mevalonate 3,5-bisphosphate decarboxylase family protein n=1 Tax=Salinimicrobium sp. TH3 TaxID=2997342 RepID=UPI002273E637|nr:diphosphomevalonate decarboxylase [Salinimicrobium sp. TH3]MCY2688545.1 diphosphomevalonate decarboxylase [Salinimicrobium sp. TH3]
MTKKDFIPKPYKSSLQQGEVTWESPSNIALVKYWGKLENQIPANPSISFTLDHCRTTTTLKFQKKQRTASNFDFELVFEGEKKESFRPKIQKFLERVEPYLPFLKDYSFTIETSNSFPHSSGIASSASGMSALALCFMSLEKQLDPEMDEEYFTRKSSFLARLGSGSACRSIEGELVVWGMHNSIYQSSDLYGVPFRDEVHENFKNYRDTILLVDKGEKQVSSTVGHDLMNDHPYAETRFRQAHDNLDKLKKIFRSGDLEEFIKVVESEALTLHAMMMTSQPYFLLMKPNTLAIINKIFRFREETGLHACFTLDAGANVHLLYPDNEAEQTLEFIENELKQYCQNSQYINDKVGSGAKKMA